MPNVRLDGVTLEDAVRGLNKDAADAGATFGKPVFVLWNETDPIPKKFRRFSPEEQAYMRAKYGSETTTESFADGATQPSPAHSTPTSARISLSIDYDSLDGIASRIAREADRCLEEDEDAQQVLILPEFVLCPPIVTKEIYFDNDPLPLFHFPLTKPTSTPVDLRSVLESNGVQFLPGSFAYYEPKQRKIVVRGQRIDVELVHALFSPTPMYDSPCERRRAHLENLWWQVTRHLPSFIRPSFPAFP